MSGSGTHVVWADRDCLAPAASPGVASSDISPNSADHLFATTTLINYVQLSGTFCNILPRKTFLQTVHGRWDRRCSKMSQVSHFSLIQVCPSGFLTHVHKSTSVKRKTGLILAEPSVWTCGKLIFFGCLLQIRELEIRSLQTSPVNSLLRGNPRLSKGQSTYLIRYKR